MRIGRFILSGSAAGVLLLTVVACTSSSTADGTPSATVTTTPTATATATTTTSTTATASGSATGAPVTGTPSGSTTTTSGGAASGPGLCTPTVMTFAVGRGEGAAGTSYFSVTATNASRQSCVTTGYPGVALVNAAGKQVLQAARDTTKAPTTITVAPGDEVTATIAAASAAADNSRCATYPAVLFTLPDNTDSTKLTHSVFACAVRVAPFVAGG